MKQVKIFFIFLAAGTAVLSFFAIKALADISDIRYPVPQLGNCNSESECKSYCDKPENLSVCLAFAEQNNLMSREEMEMAKKFQATGGKGPGGCTGRDACETFCNDINHIDECVSFAEQNDLMLPGELEEARKVRDAIKRGVKPPPCGSKKACDSYCEDSAHMEECIAFASEADLMSGQEKDDAQKMLQALRRGVKPPPCRGKKACDEYCQQPDNMEACMNFALEAGFMGDKEKEDAQKMLSAIKKGVRPPNCRGKEECDSYCQSDEHFEECANFAEAAGFMSAEEANMARKTKGKGPGGCKGKEECEAFCNNPANQDACFKFAEENNMIPEEELKKMKEGMGRMREDLDRMPSETRDCLKSSLGEETFNKIQSGELMPGPQLGDAMQNCFQKMPPPGEDMRRREGMPPGEEGVEFRRGPGGCSTPEECEAYCSQNPEACKGGFGEPRNDQEHMGQPGEFEGRPMPPDFDRNQFAPPGEPREGMNPREWERKEWENGQMPPGEGRMPPEGPMPPEFRPPEGMPPGGQIPPEFQRQEGMPPPGGEMMPPQGFEGQMPPTEFRPPEDFVPQMDQMQQQPQGEMAPPPPPPSEPVSEPAPQSLLDNKYLGAIFRFLNR